jgi:uncharacterized protein
VSRSNASSGRAGLERLERRLSLTEARAVLVSHAGLARFDRASPTASVRKLLETRRCIQLDPLDPMGKNAELVVLARVERASSADLTASLFPGYAFEHFAKERCLLPASAFPHYREQAVETPWWRHSERMKKLDPGLLAAVLDEVRARGPIAAAELEPRGRVTPMDWSGWKGTSSATKLALEVLWTRCDVVVAGQRGRHKLFDVPARALPHVAQVAPTKPFGTWALLERAEASGLLSRAAGPWWSMLSSVRTSALPDELVARGELEAVRVEGLARPHLAPSGFLKRTRAKVDHHMRILGPLDPLLWDRALVRHVFGFDYVWEVYKPAHERKFGWYVCPLLHQGQLVGRLEGRREEGTLVIHRLWREPQHAFDEDALDAALERHATAIGCDSVVRRPGARRRAARVAK